MRSKWTIPALLLIVALVLPAAALAQSAGDEQYADPFGGAKKTQPKKQSTPGPSGNQQTAQSNSGADPTPPAAAPTASSKAGDRGKRLPYTGLPAGLIAALGLISLVGGVALRAALRPLVPSLLGRGPETLGREILLKRRPPRR